MLSNYFLALFNFRLFLNKNTRFGIEKNFKQMKLYIYITDIKQSARNNACSLSGILDPFSIQAAYFL